MTIGRIAALFILSLGLLSELGCKTKLRDRQSVMSYVQEKSNHLNVQLISNGIDFELTVLPWQIQAYDSRFSKLKIKEGTIGNFKKKLFFMLAFSKDGKELLRQLDFNTYSEMVQVLSFRMDNYIDLTGVYKEPIKPAYCLFQQTYGTSAANNLLIVFNSGDLLNSKTITVRVKEFGLSTGDLSFRFNVADINNLQSITQSK